VLLACIATIVAWRWHGASPLAKLATPKHHQLGARFRRTVVGSAHRNRGPPPPACFVMFPRPLITLFAVVAFGTKLGVIYAVSGIMIAAEMTYFAGMLFDRGTVRRVAGAKLNRVTEILRRRGLLAVTALRLVPLAPFAVEGLVAGAIRFKLWHFTLGTALGIIPAR
jgi:hypothetical protein